MELRKLVGIKGKVEDSLERPKRDEKNELAKAFKGTLNRVNDRNKRVIGALTKKVRDQQEQAEEYQELIRSFKDKNEEMMAKLLETSKQVEELRNAYDKIKIEYNSVDGTIKIGSDFTQEASLEEFKGIINVLSVVIPNLKVKLEVEKVEEAAEKVRDSLHSKWSDASIKDFCDTLDSYAVGQKPIDYQQLQELANKYGTVYLINRVSALPNASDLKSEAESIKGMTELNRIEDTKPLSSVADLLEKYISEYNPSYLQEIDEASLPENLQKVVSILKKSGFLNEDEYEEYGQAAKQELREAGVMVPSFAMLKDTQIMSLTEVKQKLKEMGIMDSVWKKIPGVPSRFRIADRANAVAGFERPQVLKEGGVFIIYQ